MLTVIFPSHPAFQRSVSNAQRLFNNMKEKYVPWAPTGEQEWTPDLTTGESAAYQPVLCLPQHPALSTQVTFNTALRRQLLSPPPRVFAVSCYFDGK